MIRAMALSVIVILVGTSSGIAQFRQQTPEKGGFGVTADLIFAQMGGGVSDSVGSGLGAGVSVFVEPTGTPARIGAGASYTRFSLEGPAGSLKKLSLYALVGLQIVDPQTSVIPYIQGTVGYTRLSDDELCNEFVCGTGTTLRGRVRSGIELGTNVGVDIPLTETINVDVAGSFSWMSLGDLEAGGQTIEGAALNGSTFGIRAGITIYPR